MIPKKKWISILVLAALFMTMTPVWAADTGILTLTEAKELALDKARAMQNLGLNQDKLKIDAKMAYDQYFGTDLSNNIDGYNARLKQLQSQLSDPTTNPADIPGINTRIAEIEAIVSKLKTALPATEDPSNMLRLQWRATDYAYEDMDRTIQDTEKTLELNVENMYFGIMNIQQAITLQNKNLELLGMQLKIERLKRELGMSTEVDEKGVALQYDLLYKSLDSLKNTRQILAWQFNDLLGRDVNSELLLQAESITPLSVKFNYDELLSEAMDNSLSLAQMEREIKDYAADARKESNSSQRSSLLLSQDIAELALEDLKESMKVNVRALLNDLDASYKTWENKALEKARAEIAFQNDKIKYELGMISKLQYLLSEWSYLKAGNDESTAAQEWYLARHKAELVNEGVIIK